MKRVLKRLLKEYEDCNYHLTIRFERQDLIEEEQDLFALLGIEAFQEGESFPFVVGLNENASTKDKGR